jgi:hypothetical protein
VWYNEVSRPPKCIRKSNKFGRNAKTCWRTFANPFWRSVPTCSVLLRTEAGGTPAFQSVAASRQLLVAPTLGDLVNRCVLAIPLSASDNDSLATLFTKKAWQSVAHLTLPSGGRLPTLRCRPAVNCSPYVAVQRTVGYLTILLILRRTQPSTHAIL